MGSDLGMDASMMNVPVAIISIMLTEPKETKAQA